MNIIRKVTDTVRGWSHHRNEVAWMREHLRADDAFFVGHPKSGNTWMAYMLAILSNPETHEEITTANVGDYIPTLHARDKGIVEYEHLKSPRIFRNEGPLYPETYPKVLYIHRDPRAALVSYYHHCVHDTGESDWAIEDFIDEMLENGCIQRLEPFLVAWGTQILDWYDKRSNGNVHIVSYEGLKQDCLGEMRKVAKFLELDATDELLQLAVERGDFSAMRKQEETHGAESFPGEKGSKGFFVRKGAVDGWREELPESCIAKIEQKYAEAMAVAGYARTL